MNPSTVIVLEECYKPHNKRMQRTQQSWAADAKRYVASNGKTRVGLSDKPVMGHSQHDPGTQKITVSVKNDLFLLKITHA